MKTFIMAFAVFAFNMQGQKVYKYYMYLDSPASKPQFTKTTPYSIYSGTNNELKAFFASYKIITFEKAFPAVDWESLSKVLTIETESPTLAADLIKKYPGTYIKYDDLTNDVIEVLSYPNDYGSTNPGTNVGPMINRKDLDYINIPKAWDITTGVGTKIGISDTKINTTDADFVNKVSFVGSYSFQGMPYNAGNSDTYHGTLVGGVAAARGNNGYSSTGVCYNCDIIHTSLGNYNNLLLLAQAGARVINLSWGSGSNSPVGYQANQIVIDSLNSHYKVTVVAAAGNTSSYQTSVDKHCGAGAEGTLYFFPASYNGVISVSGVYHKNPMVLPLTNSSPTYSSTSPTGLPLHVNFEHAFGQSVDATDPYNPAGIVFNGWPEWCNIGQPSQYVSSPNGLVPWYTSNPLVDILAPTYDTFRFDIFAEQAGQITYTNGGTSSASPRVAATAALMVSVDGCLLPDEVDDILKLTSWDVESMSINTIFHGQIGAGSLNAGDAVEFVNEMKKTNGSPLIKNHVFDRFDFKLKRLNNKLTIENVTFKDLCKVDFEAKNQIFLKPGTHLKPSVGNTDQGNVHLKTNPSLSILCSLPLVGAKQNLTSSEMTTVASRIVLYPNPNNGTFTVDINEVLELQNVNVAMEIADINGRMIYKQQVFTDNSSKFTLPIQIQGMSDGLYFVKLFTDNYSETLKFIKN